MLRERVEATAHLASLTDLSLSAMVGCRKTKLDNALTCFFVGPFCAFTCATLVYFSFRCKSVAVECQVTIHKATSWRTFLFLLYSRQAVPGDGREISPSAGPVSCPSSRGEIWSVFHAPDLACVRSALVASVGIGRLQALCTQGSGFVVYLMVLGTLVLWRFTVYPCFPSWGSTLVLCIRFPPV